MSIPHKFKTTDWGNGFETNNAILDVTPYEPEVLVLGTFNPDTPNANHADFFYGRNYFWPALKNLFIHNEITLNSRRINTVGSPPPILNPNLEEIFILCNKLKLSFTDLVIDVLQGNNTIYHIKDNDNIILNGVEYNLINDNKNKGIGGLRELDLIGQVTWNITNIKDYLLRTPSIKTIYFTRSPSGIWEKKWHLLKKDPSLSYICFKHIYTPSGRRLKKPVMINLLTKWKDNFHNDLLLQHSVNIN